MFDIGGMDFFDYSKGSGSTDLDIAVPAPDDVSASSESSNTCDMNSSIEEQWNLNPLCTCQSLIFDLYSRLIAVESLLNSLQSPRHDDRVIQRLTLLEARLEKQ